MPAQANNIKKSLSVLENWAFSKFVYQLTQNDVSLIIEKRTDLESMIGNELFAKIPGRAQSPKLKEDLATWVIQ